jgi:hypothetical protein
VQVEQPNSSYMGCSHTQATPFNLANYEEISDSHTVGGCLTAIWGLKASRDRVESIL